MKLREGKPGRVSAIYHSGLEGLGELKLVNEPDIDVSRVCEVDSRAWKGRLFSRGQPLSLDPSEYV